MLSKFLTISFTSRYQAFLYHLLLSLLFAGGVLLFAKLAWYPGDLVFASGAVKIFFLVLLVDACFGPLITLLTYNLKKGFKELNRDFLFIVLLQVCALAYGFYTLAGGRPVYYVFAVDRFELVQANEIPHSFLKEAKEFGPYGDLPWWRVKWVYAELPKDNDARTDILFKQIENGVDLAQTPKYFQSLDQGRDAIATVSYTHLTLPTIYSV